MSPLDVQRSEGVPHDRLTMLADVAAAAAETSALWRAGDRVIVFVSDDAGGGATWQGYDGDDVSALVDTIEHLRALAQAQGVSVQVHPAPGRG